MDVLVGIDLGTSGVKAMVAGVGGAVLAESEAPYPVHSPRPGWAESDPEDWWAATVTAVRDAVARARGSRRVRPVAVGLAGQMHGLVLAGADSTVRRPAMLWPDSRAESQVSAWTLLPEADLSRLANPVLPGMTGPLLRWATENEPDAMRNAWVLLPKDWLRLRLTGVTATDPSDASATLLWDVPGETWSAAALGAAGVDQAMLPPVVASTEVAGQLTEGAAAALRLPAGTPVATGAADTPAALLAALSTGADAAATLITVGSGAQILTRTSAPVAVPGTHVYRTAEPSGWYRMAATANAGLALGWVRDAFDASWGELLDAYDATSPGAGGAMFTPFLTPERFGSSSQGGFSGLRLGTRRVDLLRAALDSVAFTIRRAAELLPEPLAGEVHIAGGIGRTPTFAQPLADVLDLPLRPVPHRSLTALGACHLAARAADTATPTDTTAPRETLRPGPNATDYRTAYTTWREHCS